MSASSFLIEQVLAFLASSAPEDARRAREKLEATLAGVTDSDFARVAARVASAGADWGYYEPDPLARRLNHALGELVFEPGTGLEQAENLSAARKQPVILVANHLSFADANLLECMLYMSGFDDIAKKLTVLVGPKVYSVPFRRLLSLCFGCIKTPQSPSRASGEAVMDRREVARLATEVIELVHKRRAEGEHLLVFVEGTRSRTGRMQQALAAVSRYLDDPELEVVPLGIHGSERLVPVGEERLHKTRVVVRVGRAFRCSELTRLAGTKRRLVMDSVGVAIARLLPSEYRGAYADEADGLDRARQIADELVSL